MFANQTNIWSDPIAEPESIHKSYISLMLYTPRHSNCFYQYMELIRNNIKIIIFNSWAQSTNCYGIL